MMIVFVVCFAMLGSICVESRNPLIGLNVKQLIIRQGYPVETHKIVTEDGYILQTIRIPRGKNAEEQTKRPVVLIFHGLMGCAADWVNMEQDSLGFMLVENGYDVWLANQRGNTMSRKHVMYNASKHAKQFYNFSLHEVGIYDIPANIDYIRNVTKQERMFYIGYSQGVTVWFVLASSKPQYKKHVSLMIAIGPAVLRGQTKNSLINLYGVFKKQVDVVVEVFGLYELFSFNPLLAAFVQLLCNEQSVLIEVCVNVMYLTAGRSQGFTNRKMIAIIASNAPAGASFSQLQHFFQFYRSGNFNQFDHGKKENLRIYGSEIPPSYPIGTIDVPTAVFYGSHDALISIADVENLISVLPNVVYAKKVFGYNHMDIVWGTNVVDTINNNIIQLFKNFSAT